MTDTKERVLIGWCNNDSCGEPIYKFDIHFIDGGEMYCDDCHVDEPIKEL